MDFLAQYGMFLLKLVTVIIAIGAVLLLVLGGLFGRLRSRKTEKSAAGQLEVRHLNTELEQAATKIDAAMLSGKGLKALRKTRKAASKRASRQDKRRNVFVLDFHGDIRAEAVTALREEVSALLSTAEAPDEVVVRLESVGGLVHGYGLAAAQLQRIRDRQIRLTVIIDKVAASGGYMMACVGDRILAAPFAILGSIGVVAALPNFNRVLKNHDIEYEQFTAGEYKRTVTLFGENTDSQRQKFQSEIEDVHALFKDFVGAHRPQLDLDKVATGEYWHGTRALEHRLVDELATSDDYLLRAGADADLYRLRWKIDKTWTERLTSQAVGKHVLQALLKR